MTYIDAEFVSLFCTRRSTTNEPPCRRHAGWRAYIASRLARQPDLKTTQKRTLNMTQRFDDNGDDHADESFARAAELASPSRRKIALGLASLPLAMMARPSFAAAPPTSQVNTTGRAITDTTVTVG